VFVVREATMLAVWLNAWVTDQVVWARDSVNARAGAKPSPVPHEEG
jgi:ceramide glucosyltransferase